LLIATAAIIPLAVVYGLALDALLQAQRAQTRASTVGVARAIATAVDSELRMTVAALEALALTEPLGTTTTEGLSEAYQLVTAVRASHPEWRDLLLAAPDGRILFSTERSAIAPGASVVDRASLQDVVSEPRPVIGAMTRGPRGQLAFAVRVPVLRTGELRHVLTAVVDPVAVTAVLRRQRIPEGWTVSVFDSRQARVARNVDDDRLNATGWALPPPSTACGQGQRSRAWTQPPGWWCSARQWPRPKLRRAACSWPTAVACSSPCASAAWLPGGSRAA
jgi:hypothetical protein